MCHVANRSRSPPPTTTATRLAEAERADGRGLRKPHVLLMRWALLPPTASVPVVGASALLGGGPASWFIPFGMMGGGGGGVDGPPACHPAPCRCGWGVTCR